MRVQASNRATASLRLSEWILAGYFSYTSLLAVFLPLASEVRIRILAVSLAILSTYALLRWFDDPADKKWLDVTRDWLPMALAIVAYRQMGWFATARLHHSLEHGWIGFDKLLLGELGGRHFIEMSAPVLPNILELSYLLVYALPAFAMAMLYTQGLRKSADILLVFYLLGLLLAYAQFPFWPSDPPRTAFPGVEPPSVHSIFREANLIMLGNLGIHTGVFPSAHVSGAFALAFAMQFLGFKPWLRRGTLIYAMLVAIATVYGRYHYAVDALAGFGVALVAAGVASFVFDRPSLEHSRPPLTHPSCAVHPAPISAPAMQSGADE
jgi:membrane-associated phospholipid phosphatase